MRDDMFFGTSILHWFWRGLGRGLGPQNRCFSHIFRCFFDVKIEVRFGTRKNWSTNRKKQTFPLFGAGFAVPGGPWGERKRERGTNFGRRISKKNFEIIPKMPSQSLARRCPPRWGGGLKPPRGGCTAAHPLLARLWSSSCFGRFLAVPAFSAFSAFLAILALCLWTTISRKRSQKQMTNSKHRPQNPPKSRPGASKIEPGALQDASFKRHLT